jgi:type I restriction enzyme M protein
VEEAPEESALAELAKEGALKAAALKLKIKELEKASQEDDAQELEPLKKALELTTAIQEERKKVRKLTGELEQKCHEQYAKLTREEILDLLIGKKWMASLEKGIHDLYAGISHALTNRIVELADRYGTPLPELEKEADELENSVKSHLEGMGFVW